VVLGWSGGSSQVTGYYTYRGSVSGGPYSKLTSAPIDLTSYTDQSVIGGNTYYYVVTAVDDAGMESSYSEQVEAVIPAA
jgi:fibronectin type 3 domain-containing protein